MRHGIALLALGFGTAAAGSTCPASSCPTRNVITAGDTAYPPATRTNEGDCAAPTETGAQSVATPAFNWKSGDDIDTGDIHCVWWCRTNELVDETSCDVLMSQQWAPRGYPDVDLFYLLNPTLSEGCVGIRPNTEYCVDGFIEPLRAYDGRCGPLNHNARCCGMEMGSCCNSETWTCGESEKDCSFGVCYDGSCPGHKVFTTDGTCGYQNQHRRCAGKWGDCCSVDGECGTGWDYCQSDKRQSGNCFPPRYHMEDCIAGICSQYLHYFEDPSYRYVENPSSESRLYAESIDDEGDRPGFKRRTRTYADYVVIEWVPIPTTPATSTLPWAWTLGIIDSS